MSEETNDCLAVVPGRPWGVNFGGGVNSVALLLFCRDRGLVPDWILFSDTG